MMNAMKVTLICITTLVLTLTSQARDYPNYDQQEYQPPSNYKRPPYKGNSYNDDYQRRPAAPNYDSARRTSVASQVQSKLAAKGFYYGKIDGILGPQSRDAIAQYQSQHRVRVTGYIDEWLLKSLGLL
jgi:hypothetical protein